MEMEMEIVQRPQLSARAQEKQPEAQDSRTFPASGFTGEGKEVKLLLKAVPRDPLAIPGLSEMQASSSHSDCPSPLAAESSRSSAPSWDLERLEYFREVDGGWQSFKDMDLDELRRLEDVEDSARPTQLASLIRYAIFSRTGAIEDLDCAIDRAKGEIPIRDDDPDYASRMKDLIVMLVEKYKRTNAELCPSASKYISFSARR
ncbi:hypothetical protein BGZ60DRAFT_245621 [Tricladium varicosporioides]|nr:hypothetical protein BGZ60DRAFT_245621 [Hymenoscyphus varicosporioides]